MCVNAFAHFKIYGNYREAFEAEIVDPEVAKFASIAKLLNQGKSVQPITTRARSVKIAIPPSAKKCNRCARVGHMKVRKRGIKVFQSLTGKGS
jgi:hypothetical protein